ncbi:MAG: TolC family protein [Myxococcota bacterium]
MMKKAFNILFAISVVITPVFRAGAQEGGGDISLELAAQAIASNQGIFELNREIASLMRRSDAARMWDRPVVSVEYMDFPWNTFGFDDMGMTGVQVMLMQMFPFPGKNDRRQAAASADVETKRWELEGLKLNLSGLVRTTYYRLALNRQLEKVTDKHIELIEQLISAVRAKYESGRANQQDILRLTVLRERLRDDLNDYRQQDIELSAMINSTLHRDVATAIETPLQIKPPPPDFDFEPVFAEALDKSPMLKMFSAHASAMRLAAERERYEIMPDISLSAGYKIRAKSMNDDGVDYLSVGISLPLPFDYTNRFDNMRLEMLEKASSAEFARKKTADAIAFELKKGLSMWKRAFQKARTYETEIYPSAERTLAAALLAYQTDRADFASLYQAEVELIDFEREIYTAKVDAAIMKIHIETMLGSGLENLSVGAKEIKENADEDNK